MPTFAPSLFCVSLPVTVRPFAIAFACSVAAPVCDTAPEILSVLIVPAAVCDTVVAVMPLAPVTVIVPAPSCVSVLPAASISSALTIAATAESA